MVSIRDYYKDKAETYANSPSIEVLEGISEQHFPCEGLFVGQLEIGHGFAMPALIDLLSTNGISFMYKTVGERKLVNHLLERMCWRLALTVPTRLCEFVIYGGDVMAGNLVSMEMLPQVFFADRPCKIYYDTHEKEFTKLLETIVSNIPKRLTQIRLADYGNDEVSLVRVNEKEGDDAKIKYQFLILADFPKHLTEEQSSLLTRIITQGAAAGIYVIMSWDMDQPYRSDERNGFDYSSLLKTMTLIYPNGNYYMIKNYPLEDKINKTFFSLDKEKLTASDIKGWAKAIEDYIKVSKQVSLDIRRNVFTHDTIWKEDGRNGVIRFPIGKQDSKTMQYMQLDTSTLAHAFIGGATGSGKSMLIHDIIINASWLYSPEELQFILLDFQGGAYDMYRNLPHTKLICHGGGRVFANKAMTYVINEMQRRQSLIGEMQISEYNSSHPDKKLPSIIVIIDEIQRTDTENTREAKTDLANNLTAFVKEGRRVGMHLISATQAPSDSTFYMNNKDQIAVRIALKMKNDDDFVERSGSGSDRKPDLSQFDAYNREALYNDNFGTYHNSSMFRYAFYGTDPLRTIKGEMIPALIEKANCIYGKSSPIDYQCFYKEGWADVDSNPHWIKEETSEYKLFVGCPHTITESHVSFTLPRRNGNNILSIGLETDAALSFSYHIHRQMGAQSTSDDMHYFMWIDDKMALNAYDAAIMAESSETTRMIEGIEASEVVLMKVLGELERRKQENNADSGRIVIDIFDIERFRTVHNLIYSIVKEGPYYGIFTCIYAGEYSHFEAFACESANTQDAGMIDPLDAFSSGFPIPQQPGKKELIRDLKRNFSICVEFRNGEGYKLLDDNSYESDINHPYEANIKIDNSTPIKFNLYKI